MLEILNMHVCSKKVFRQGPVSALAGCTVSYPWIFPIIVYMNKSIDLFRGACAVKGNVQVAGHVKRVDNGATFNA